MHQNVLRLPANQHGRDFVVGDIHFKTTDLYKALKAVGFDRTVDRLIGVGDVIDRGPGVLDGLKLLGEPWFYTVPGNHEDMLINAYRNDPDARYCAHGAGWWATIDDGSKGMIIDKLESLPTVIEIESPRGLVGVIHADVPERMSWSEFVARIDDPQIKHVAQWSMRRVSKHDRAGVPGIWRVCTGHTWIPRPLRLGNFLSLDCSSGGEGPLVMYCVQDDTIYMEGRPVSLSSAEVVTEQLQQLEGTLANLKTMAHANKLIESQGLSAEADALAKQINSGWLNLRDDISEPQRLINALHGLSLTPPDRKASKLEQISASFDDVQIKQLLHRLFG
jgi:serine/threonine protein phosphatase 1